MTSEEIINQLMVNYKAFTDFIVNLDEKEFLFTEKNKWTAGQQAEHILRSVKPVTLAFGLPLFFLRIMFGKANRPSRGYGTLVHRYYDKLAAGGKASGRFIPPEIAPTQKEKICKDIIAATEKLCSRAAKYSDEELDKYILPHPLFGKLTCREMLYFTIYHVEHHHNNIKEMLHK
ncbi:MAG TPA: DinB family protein [Panacibacter sp.]|nr:DinB family protein [Panacibacter sp.]